MKEEFFHLAELALLRPDATRDDVRSACAMAKLRQVRALAINSSRVALAFSELEESEVKVISTLGFPMGTADADVKRFEAEVAIDLGAQEFELVLNLGLIRDRDEKSLLREVRDIVAMAEERPVSLLLSPRLLSREDQVFLFETMAESGIKSLNAGQVDLETVRFLRQSLGEKWTLKVNANLEDGNAAREVLAAGATFFTIPLAG